MRRLIPGRLTSLFLTGVVLSVMPSVARAQNAPEEITFNSFDGVKLQGDWYPSDKTTKAPTALLIHKLGGDHKQMAPVAESLQAAGFAVLSFDLRGHGGSTSITPNDFWKNPKNASNIRGWKPNQNTIDFKNFIPTYYPYLLNDIAAAKYFLEKKNNARECNVNDLVIVGADDGATLAALWLYTEWDRRRVSPNPMGVAFPPKVGEPEGKDIAAAVFLSIRPTLGSGKTSLIVNTPIHQAFQGAMIKDINSRQALQQKVGYCFIYGNEDKAAMDLSTEIYGNVLAADKNKLKLTYKVALKTKLTGSDLLAKEGLDVEKTVATYLKDRVFESRKSTVWDERELKAYPVVEVPLKSYGIPSP